MAQWIGTSSFNSDLASEDINMILSDVDIERRLEEGDLVIEPLDDPELQIQPASVDLRLGREFLQFKDHGISVIHPNSTAEVNKYVGRTTVGRDETNEQRSINEYSYSSEEKVKQEEGFRLHPGRFVLGTTKERVEIPHDIIAHVQGRSSLGRLAILVHATAGVVDPGFRGQITLELSNLGAVPVILEPGMRISQLTFTELSSPARRPYGADRGSKYQDQEGPRASRVNEDHEFGGNQK